MAPPANEGAQALGAQFRSAAAAWGVAGIGLVLIVLGLCVPLAPGAAVIHEQLRILQFGGMSILGFGMLMLGFTYVFNKMKIELPGIISAEIEKMLPVEIESRVPQAVDKQLASPEFAASVQELAAMALRESAEIEQLLGRR